MKNHAPFGIIAIAGALWLACFGASATSIINSAHNLSVSSTNLTIKAATQTNLCTFCHTVHHADGSSPLWNHTLSSVTNYIVYSSSVSSSFMATPGQPNGSSRLCLSCHDGTVALGMVNSRAQPIQMQGTVTTMPVGDPNNLGTDLSGDHPISFTYNSALLNLDHNLNDPSTLPSTIKLDSNSQVQCTTCHDAHNDQFGNFLVVADSSASLCLYCHKPGTWSGSGHALANKLIPQRVRDLLNTTAKSPQAKKDTKPKTVAANGCANCHTSHAAGGKARLLRFPLAEQNCLSCHQSNGVGADIASDFQKISVHPLALNPGSHEPNENPVNPAKRHVTCSDCHDPHSATTSRGSAKKLPGALLGVTGVNSGGGVVKAVSSEAELCFRCHADSISRGPSQVSRQVPQTNKRLQFAVSNMSFHPVEAVGKNSHVPSLIQPWTTASTLSCIDCHNSDQSPATGGKGANGAHGSAFAPLLERQLILTDYSVESAANYALCYKCHSRTSILNDQSFHAVSKSGGEAGHRFHVVDQKTACTTCHDSHGVASSQRLINFNVRYVSPASNGRLQYIAGIQGPSSGTCTLKCHGYDHIDARYTPVGTSVINPVKLLHKP